MLHPGSRLPGMRCTVRQRETGLWTRMPGVCPCGSPAFRGAEQGVPFCSGSADSAAAGLRDGCILLGMLHGCGSIACRKGYGNTQISHVAGRHSGAGGTGIRKYRMPQSSAVAQGLHEYANIACRREEQWRRGYGNTQISYAAERRRRAGVTGMRKHHMPQGLCIYAGCCDGETARGFFA